MPTTTLVDEVNRHYERIHTELHRLNFIGRASSHEELIRAEAALRESGVTGRAQPPADPGGFLSFVVSRAWVKRG